VADADRRLRRLLDDADRYADQSGLSSELWAPDRPAPVEVAPQPDRLDLAAEQIGTVLLATGYRPHHPWLRLPVTAPDGSIVQRRGVTASPGLYVVGQRFQHRRDSGFIDGARHDAAFVVDHLCSRPSSHAATRLVRIP
jgi:putative flavoprotein involved in K+ transport